MTGNLYVADSPFYNFGILPTSAAVERAITLTNNGASLIVNLVGTTPLTTRFSYKGGAYPGTGGTCTSSLAAAANCTIIVTASSSTAGTFTDQLSFTYTDALGGPYLTRRIVSAQFTATTITSIFVAPTSGNFNPGNTQQIKCYGNTSDGGTIDLTNSCVWTSANTGVVTVDDSSNKGLITGVANGGPVNITATYSPYSATASITVSAAAASFVTPGVGLNARYYSTTSGGAPPQDALSVLVNSRIDGTVAFAWGTGTNPAGGVNNFGARWTGQITAPTSGAYCIQTRSDDGLRLWINNTLIINNYTAHAATNDNGTFTFVANQKYDIVMEFFEAGGDAEAHLRYIAGACGTPTTVPQANLYPTATRALDMGLNTMPRYTNAYRGFPMNGAVGAIANGAAITGLVGGGGATPVNAVANNTNGTGMAYVGTERSQGVNFDGTDDYISVAASTLPTGSAARTIAAWVRPTSTGTTLPVTFYGTNTAGTGYGIEILSSGRIRHSITGTTCTSAASLSFSTWQFVAVTLTGTTTNIYINGALDSTCTMGATAATAAGSTLFIGRDIAGTTFFQGQIDEVSYWNIVLTAGEVNTFFERTRVVNPP